MAETTTDGPVAFDFPAAKAALMSSSTTARQAQLRVIDEKIAQKGTDSELTYLGSPLESPAESLGESSPLGDK